MVEKGNPSLDHPPKSSQTTKAKEPPYVSATVITAMSKAGASNLPPSVLAPVSTATNKNKRKLSSTGAATKSVGARKSASRIRDSDGTGTAAAVNDDDDFSVSSAVAINDDSMKATKKAVVSTVKPSKPQVAGKLVGAAVGANVQSSTKIATNAAVESNMKTTGLKQPRIGDVGKATKEGKNGKLLQPKSKGKITALSSPQNDGPFSDSDSDSSLSIDLSSSDDDEKCN
jgi:hypothetical protein